MLLCLTTAEADLMPDQPRLQFFPLYLVVEATSAPRLLAYIL